MHSINENTWLNDKGTPYLLLDEDKISENIDRLKNQLKQKNVKFRPHLKTLKSVEFARKISDRSEPVTVSTLAEAEIYAASGYSDILYAVGISEHKLPRIARIMSRGSQVHILIDTLTQADFVAAYGVLHNVNFSVFIEIDCDGHRGGILPESSALLPIANRIITGGSTLTGVMTHAGESYHCTTEQELRRAAEEECRSVLTAADILRSAGIGCPVLSVGSTPTAHYFQNMAGITEVRAGVVSTFDLFMANVGICQLENIAISVVATVIGQNPEKNWLFVDAGWMSLSRDRGTAGQKQDYKYGLVCLMSGEYTSLLVDSTSQEHGIILLSENCGYQLTDFPIGSRIRILPNHACATAAMHQQYEVVSEEQNKIESWLRISGW